MHIRPLLALLLGVSTPPAVLSAEAPTTPAKQICVDVAVNGQRAPSFSCLTEKLTPSADARNTRATTVASEAIVNRASNQLGLFNRAATSHRMGNTFGTSARPQRPPTPTPASPLLPVK
ncbi:hypothetical protein JM946_16605 [Steroidobacter sp. S1-65]|uniref:Uncharacterized protein n=1 Tax=Steroidobacter gossypii TaxID=2805490 RepID=A0ABS1WZF3_9GAMM|nr:hypothetical protein [Steroidobacter gossypii]MBM0106357.1 hypothetical protein [Steroidobacter gossypii]